MMKRVISLIFALVMIVTMLPITAVFANAEEPYYSYTDFTTATPDNGSAGNITANLPTGWIANDDPNLVPSYKKWPTAINYDWAENPHNVEDGVYCDEQKTVGVRLGGAGQGIAMTDAANVPEGIRNGSIDYTITVKWNTTHKFAHIRFGWSGGAVPTKNSVIASQNLAFNYTGGPSNVGTVNEAFGDGLDKGGNFIFNNIYCSDRRDADGNQVDHNYIDNAWHAAAAEGAQVTTAIEVVSGRAVAVHNTLGGVTVTYLASNDIYANGYFSIWITNWGDNNTVNIQSVELKEGTEYTPSDTPDLNDEFPNVYNEQVLTSVDFTTIKTDFALADAGFVWNSVTAPNADTGWVPHFEYADDGLALKGGSNDFLINTDVALDNNSTYIIDYTFKMNPSVWVFLTEFGFTSDMLVGDEYAVNSALVTHHTYADTNCSFKQRANESGNMLAVDTYSYYTDGSFATHMGEYNPSVTAVENACGSTKTPIRIRIIVSKGTSSLAFMTVGDEQFYLKRSVNMTQDSVAGHVGFTFVGTSRAARGVTLQKFSITKCELDDITGGKDIKPEKDKAYTDAASTYYKDGYVLHNMDFSKVADWDCTGYSFAANSSTDRIVKIENDVLKFTNSGNKAAYLIFTANAIPAAITEYTANYKFRFVGDANSYFGFVRGITLKEDGTRDRCNSLELSYANSTISDCGTSDTEAWTSIVTAMKTGEWVEVSISNVGRYVESVTVKCGGKIAMFRMDPQRNKVAVDGYMGFIIGKTTSVEVAYVTILAGKADKAATPIWPTGTQAGDIVQNVATEAVAQGTKPDYTDLINQIISGNYNDNNNNNSNNNNNNNNNNDNNNNNNNDNNDNSNGDNNNNNNNENSDSDVEEIQKALEEKIAELEKKIADGDKALDKKMSEFKKAEEEREKAATEREKALTDEIAILENDLAISNSIFFISQLILGLLLMFALVGDVVLLVLFLINRKKRN